MTSLRKPSIRMRAISAHWWETKCFSLGYPALLRNWTHISKKNLARKTIRTRVMMDIIEPVLICVNKFTKNKQIHDQCQVVGIARFQPLKYIRGEKPCCSVVVLPINFFHISTEQWRVTGEGNGANLAIMSDTIREGEESGTRVKVIAEGF